MKKYPKVSIVTVVKNREKSIKKALKSTLSQDYKNIEYVVLDGKSQDKTFKIINKFKNNIDKILSVDDKGIYDALNKAIKNCSGDIIGILHSDDIFFSKSVVSKNVRFMVNHKLDFTFSNLIIKNNQNKIFRKIISKNYKPELLKFGIQPPHPTLFLKKKVFSKVGNYSIKHEICGDFDYFTRLFYFKKLKWKSNNIFSVIQQRGGKSDTNFFDKWKTSNEILQILKKRGIVSFRFFFIIKFLLRIYEQIR